MNAFHKPIGGLLECLPKDWACASILAIPQTQRLLMYDATAFEASMMAYTYNVILHGVAVGPRLM